MVTRRRSTWGKKILRPVQADDGGKKTMCTLSDSGGSLSAMRLYDGMMDFHVHRMNVQGGGILIEVAGHFNNPAPQSSP